MLAAEHSNLKALVVCHHPQCQGIMKIAPRSVLGGRNAGSSSTLRFDYQATYWAAMIWNLWIVWTGMRMKMWVHADLEFFSALWSTEDLIIFAPWKKHSGSHIFWTIPISLAVEKHIYEMMCVCCSAELLDFNFPFLKHFGHLISRLKTFRFTPSTISSEQRVGYCGADTWLSCGIDLWVFRFKGCLKFLGSQL